MIRSRLALLLIFIAQCSFAQSLPQACPAGEPGNVASLCSEACVPCEGIDNGFYGLNFYDNNNFGVAPPGFCAPVFDGAVYKAFVAGTTLVTFSFTPYNCMFNAGLQVGIYGSFNCESWTNDVSVCFDQVPSGQYQIIQANCIPGQIYYFVIDGVNGDICDFEVELIDGTTLPPPIIGTPQINGPTTLCSGSSGYYQVSGVSGAANYLWELDGTVVAVSNAYSIVPPPSEGSYQLCVTPTSPCQPDGPTSCISIDVAPLPPQLIIETLCVEDFPYHTSTGLTFSSPGTYMYNEFLPNGCVQPITLILDQYPVSGPTSLEATICEGESYSVGGQFFLNEGVYDILLEDSNGCDSLVLLNLTVEPPYFTNLDTITTNQFLTVGNQIIDTYGSFEVMLSSAAGCDSIVAGFLNLSALDSIVVDTAICEGDTLFVAMDTLTESGNYSYQIADSLVYDTFLQLNLTTLDSPDTLLVDTICQGEMFMVGDSVYAESGTYTQVLQTSEGCDSTVKLELFVLQPMDTLMASICEGEVYTVGSSSYTTAGIYLDTLMGPTGCQSIVQTVLEVLPVPQTPLAASICEGDTLAFAGQLLTMSGQYADTLQAVNGCDSIVLLDLTAWPLQSTSITENICPGESIGLGGIAFTQPGNYTLTFTDANGCDSTVNLTLNWLDEPSDTIMASICDGDSYLLGGSAYEQEGVYQEIFTAVNGCDSTVTLILDVLPLDTTMLNEQICEGEGYPFAGNTYTNEGTYQVIFTSMETGCDSFVILNLMVLPASTTVLDTAICEGDTLLIGGESFFQTGNYDVLLTDQFGCDSTVQCTLTVISTTVVSLDATICEGENYEVGNSTYVESGQYTDTLLNSNGCDSVIHTNLTVLPAEVTEVDTTLCFGETFEIGPYIFTDTVNNLLQFTGTNGCDSLVDLQLSYYDEIQLENVVIENDLFGGLPDGSISIEVSGGTPPYTFFWGNGRFGRFIDLLSPGIYFVIVTDANGCQTGFSFDVYFTIEGFPGTMLTGPEDNSLRVYPNPFNEYLEVSLPFVSEEPVELRLYDAMGQEVYQSRTEGREARLYPNLPKGVYWLVALTDGKIIGIDKIIKVRR